MCVRRSWTGRNFSNIQPREEASCVNPCTSLNGYLNICFKENNWINYANTYPTISSLYVDKCQIKADDKRNLHENEHSFCYAFKRNGTYMIIMSWRICAFSRWVKWALIWIYISTVPLIHAARVFTNTDKFAMMSPIVPVKIQLDFFFHSIHSTLLFI